MGFPSFVRKHKIAFAIISVISASIIVCVVGLIIFISFLPHDNDIKYDRAIAIAKNDFGCEKVLWIGTNAQILSDGIPTVSKIRSHYSYYVVGEKAGSEIYILIPSDPELEKPFITTWSFDYLFTQIVEKFNDCGAQYVAEVSDDYYSVSIDRYINLRVGEDTINRLAGYYVDGGDDETFYERLNVKAVFEYEWEVDGYRYSCIVTQENGELRNYKQVCVIA